MTSEERFFIAHRIVRFTYRVLFKIFFRFKIYGASHVPDQGACIIVANHVSFLDPPVVAGSVRTRVYRFLARDTLYKGWLAKSYFKHMQCIPLDRTKGDIAAFRSIFKILAKGGAVALFPEGTRSSDGTLQKGKRGIGFLIAKSKVPIIPMYVAGTFYALPRGAKWFRFTKISAHYGAPLYPKDFGEDLIAAGKYDEIVEEVMRQIKSLKPSL